LQDSGAVANLNQNKENNYMPNYSIKKVAANSSQIGGLKTSRYERGGVAFGVVEASSYALGDTLVFDDVNSNDIVEATIVAHTSPSPTVLEVYPGTDTSAALVLDLPGTAVAAVKISYVIHFIRGAGRVGNTSGDQAGEGKLLRVTITA
jgi:hypothetical protein